MKTGKKLGIWLFICSLILTGLVFRGGKAYAAPTAAFSVSAGGDAALGGSVSVTVSVNGSENMAFAQVSVNYSSGILEYQSGADSGGSGRVNLLFDCGSGQKSVSRTITFKAVGTGKASISLDSAKATPMAASSGDWMNASVSGAADITVGEAKSLSADAHVASIEVSPGTLQPAFNPDVFKYTMEVENSVTSIAVTAKASHQAAKITAVSGAADLKVGENKVTVVCTAENGGTARYTITVTRKAAAGEQPQTTTKSQQEATTAPPATELTCELNGAVYYVSQEFSEKSVPEGFQIGEIQYQNQTIKGAQFSNNNQIQLIYLLNSEKQNGQFYLYYPASGLMGELVRVSFYEGSYLYLLDPAAVGAEIPVDLEETVFNVDDRELKGYQLAAPKAGLGDLLANEEAGYILERVSADPNEFVLLYGLNKDGGICWYSYDKQEKTLQRVVVYASEEEEEAAVETVSDGSENAVKKMLTTVKVYRIILLGAAALILLLILLCVLIGVNGKKRDRDEDEDNGEEDYEEDYEDYKGYKREKEKPVFFAEAEKDSGNGQKVTAAAPLKTEAAKEAAVKAKEKKPETVKAEAKRPEAEATKEIPAGEIRRKTQKTDGQENNVGASKVRSETRVSEAKVSEAGSGTKEVKVKERPEAQDIKEQEEDLGLEFFDIDDL